MKKGFTLLEMLVVIGIIAVLSGLVMGVFGKSREAALAAKCLSNMKNLATAVQSYGLARTDDGDGGSYPWAGSVEYMGMDSSQGQRNRKIVYRERCGWISWASEGVYPSNSKESPEYISTYTEDKKLGMFAVTNGALWRYTGNRSIYTCPLHTKLTQNVCWSYVMNAFFGWAAAEGYSYNSNTHGVTYAGLSAAERRLLFAEIPFVAGAPGETPPSGSGSSMDVDCVLQYKDSNKTKGSAIKGKGARDGNEYVGANHKSGRDWYAHVVFADGHIEKIRVSQDNGQAVSTDSLRKLTTWLCTGKGVVFNGKDFEELEK